MKSVIMLTISGDIYYFEDLGFTLEEKSSFQDIAQRITQESSNQNISTENEICERFVSEVKSCLGISLVPVKVSFVVRININTN